MSENISIKDITTIDRVPFNFTYYAMKLLGRNLYSNPWIAISEIVANGIDAGAPNVYVLVDMRNKEKSIVEIFDDGKGMSYEDLCNKYTLIGRNKRSGGENIDGKTLGRKGIGKLAALYLSSKYYLSTKTKEEKSCWKVDVADVEDTDIPTLQRVEVQDSKFVGAKFWSKCETGTLIQLEDVDLRKIGEGRVKTLKAILADYYLDNIIASSIYVCVLTKYNEEIIFEKIKKKIYFETMYAIYDNTGLGYKDELLDQVYITKESDLQVDKIKRDTIILPDKYDHVGKIMMIDFKNEEKEIDYKMSGWIGIHSSLEPKINQRNYAKYKKLQYRSNSLRLYVRGKLAVENLMNYVHSSQAFANYIEGEISFDVLDDDDFEDASTSNREGYSLSDLRVQKLLSIVNKIITTLLLERAKIGKIVKLERDEYFESLRLAEVRKKEQAEREKKEEEAAKIKAEQEAIIALEAQKKAEQEAIIALEAQEKAEQEAKSERNRNDFIVSVSSLKDDNVLASMHRIYTMAITCKKRLDKFLSNIRGTEITRNVHLEQIGMINQEILYVSKSIVKANYVVENTKSDVEIFAFIKNYIEKVVNKIYKTNLEIKLENTENVEKIVSIKPLNLSTIIENIIGNAKKFNTTKIIIKFYDDEDGYHIDFSDNGKGLEGKDPLEMLKFGVTSTNGSGLGLFYSSRYIEKLNGRLLIRDNEKEGATIAITLAD